ncbi:hypothetical protein R1sor_013198 [Riccia sorocarpa]|uniref:Dirigent protein n=1 Tax=Riccia sorocarpa TaxID=122646 RepID=A0ABD3H9S5_9MARC
MEVVPEWAVRKKRLSVYCAQPQTASELLERDSKGEHMAVVMVGVGPVFWLLMASVLTLRVAGIFDPQLPACGQNSQESKVLTFFMHDDLDVKGASSAFDVVPSLKTINGAENKFGFGAIVMLDDAVTEGPDVNSKMIARSRGFYMFNAINETGAALEIQFEVIFGDGSDYPGSTISYQGYDKIENAEREISIVGGTGVFRLARGWAVITTQALNRGAANLNIKSYVYYGCQAITDGASRRMSPSKSLAMSLVIFGALALFLLLSKVR